MAATQPPLVGCYVGGSEVFEIRKPNCGLLVNKTIPASNRGLAEVESTNADMRLLEYISWTMGGIGLVVILWGALLGLSRFVCLEIRQFRRAVPMKEREEIRHLFGYYLLLGLEFLVVADIVHTILTPTLEELGVLAAIVGIRTVISFSINWELKQAKTNSA